MDSTLVAALPDTLTTVLTNGDLVIPMVTVLGIIKVTALLKWLLNEKVGANIGGYAGWVLTMLVSIVWSVGYNWLSGEAVTAATFSTAVQLAFAAILGYGAASIGMFGTPGKRIATKPIL